MGLVSPHITSQKWITVQLLSMSLVMKYFFVLYVKNLIVFY